VGLGYPPSKNLRMRVWLLGGAGGTRTRRFEPVLSLNTWTVGSMAVLPKGQGKMPVTDIGSDATRRGLVNFLEGRSAIERLESSMLGGRPLGGRLESSLCLPLQSFFDKQGNSMLSHDYHFSMSYEAQTGGSGSSS